MKNNILILILLIFIIKMNAQDRPWPLHDQNTQARRLSTVGEFRTNHPHSGVDLNNLQNGLCGTNNEACEIRAVEDGEITTSNDNSGSNSYFIIGNVVYFHCVLDDALSVGNDVEEGDVVGLMYTPWPSVHIHLNHSTTATTAVPPNDVNTFNFLNQHINPYIGCTTKCRFQ